MVNPADSKPNIHYIGVIEEKNSRVFFTKYPIDLPSELLTKLNAIRKDDDNGSRLALQAEMTSYYPEKDRTLFFSSFLAPRSYTDSYVNPTHFPSIWTQEKYRCEEQKVRDEAIKAYAKDVQEREDNHRPPPCLRLEDYVESRVHKWRIELRDLYYGVAIRFICSHSYLATWEKIQLNAHPDVKMISTDTIGWTTYNYVINRDITIRLDSNFGYGEASYFLLSVIYQGIEIFPYSSYVRYYYANWRVLLRHTRSYEVTRESWDEALEFVEKCANVAITAPCRFVNEFIISEIKQMTDGLVEIMDMTQERFDEKMNPVNFKRPRYLGVSIPRKGDIECYAVYPREMLMAYKAEKITGALAFLGEIKALSGVLFQVSEYYERIVSLVNQALPEIKRDLTIIALDIKKLEDEKSPLVLKLEPLAKELQKMDLEIVELQAKSDNINKEVDESFWERSARQQKVKEEYILSHPQYNRIASQTSELKVKIREMEKDIRGRKNFFERLNACAVVASSAEEFKNILNAMRVHEEVIAKEIVDRLSKCDQTKLDPEKIDTMKLNVRREYTNKHENFKALVNERDEILSKIGRFRLSNRLV